MYNMKNYELVLLLNASSQESERKGLISDLENELKDSVIQKDDMGLITLAHDLGEKKGNNKFYFVSLYLKADENNIATIKKFFMYNKVAYRYFLFAMNKSDEMVSFEKVTAELNKIIEGWEEKKMGNKMTFFTKAENVKYITWKGLPMLKKYITRFGNIKPRKYTGNAVSVQKKLRNTIIRAREM
ncbi:TPA: 30S ribosomal protein S18 [Patescibacteria group bacterium]|nr:30S ribosomal protein S18 [Candidatus Gracilibacteria bacterium]